jgi:tetratricopeptide (TPR) repeat protein
MQNPTIQNRKQTEDDTKIGMNHPEVNLEETTNNFKKIYFAKQASGYETRGKNMRNEKFVIALFLMLFLVFTIIFPNASYGAAADKKIKKQPVQKEAKEAVAITGSNVQTSLGKAEELLKKGDNDNSLRIFIKTYDYTKEALTTMNFVQKHYEMVIKDPATDQNEREDIFIKLNRIKQLTPKYNNIKIASAYNIGYIYTKKGDSEKARKYLSEVLEATPFSAKQGSLWMKSKTLLLEVYGLEGEF